MVRNGWVGAWRVVLKRCAGPRSGGEANARLQQPGRVQRVSARSLDHGRTQIALSGKAPGRLFGAAHVGHGEEKHERLWLLFFCSCCFVQELLDGSLYSFLHARNGIPLDSKVRLQIAADIALGMSVLESSTPPLVHR